MSSTHRPYLVVIASALTLCAASAGAQDRVAESVRPGRTLTVSASAEVSVQPDQAVVRLGVLAEAPEASDAQDQVNEVMQRVLEAVTELGVPERAVRTEDLSLFPVYGEQRSGRAEPQEPVIVGYRASNVVGVEVDELARIGEIIDAGIGAGANQLQGVSFQARNDAGARAEAMRLAVEEARMQGDTVAAALRMRIEGVREVVAGGYDVRPPMPYVGGARFAVAEMAATPVQPGQVDITATVTVTFDIGANAGATD